jgi:ribonuclease-3
MQMNGDLTALEDVLGHHFQRRELLELALTHSSHAHEQEQKGGELLPPAAPVVRDNEQMEFLGDAVLGFVTSQALWERFPKYREGQLSKMRAHLVSERHLVACANTLRLGGYLRLGRGEERSGGRDKSTLLADALEAIVAAMFLDSGLETARAFVFRHIVDPELARLQQQGVGFPVTDYKSALQEALQSSGRPQPAYVVTAEEGPDHQKLFTVEVRILNKPGGDPEHLAMATGPTKKRAEQAAAQKALEHLWEKTASNAVKAV